MCSAVRFCFADQGSRPESLDGTSGSTNHLFGHSTMIRTSNSLAAEGGRAPNQHVGDQLHPTGLVWLLGMRTGLYLLPCVESELPHPPQTHRQLAGNGHRLAGGPQLPSVGNCGAATTVLSLGASPSSARLWKKGGESERAAEVPAERRPLEFVIPTGAAASAAERRACPEPAEGDLLVPRPVIYVTGPGAAVRRPLAVYGLSRQKTSGTSRTYRKHCHIAKPQRFPASALS